MGGPSAELWAAVELQLMKATASSKSSTLTLSQDARNTDMKVKLEQTFKLMNDITEEGDTESEKGGG